MGGDLGLDRWAVDEVVKVVERSRIPQEARHGKPKCTAGSLK